MEFLLEQCHKKNNDYHPHNTHLNPNLFQAFIKQVPPQKLIDALDILKNTDEKTFNNLIEKGPRNGVDISTINFQGTNLGKIERDIVKMPGIRQAKATTLQALLSEIENASSYEALVDIYKENKGGILFAHRHDVTRLLTSSLPQSAEKFMEAIKEKLVELPNVNINNKQLREDFNFSERTARNLNDKIGKVAASESPKEEVEHQAGLRL